MSALGDQYSEAARQLADIIDEHKAVALTGDAEKAEKLQQEALLMFQKVETLYRLLHADYSSKMTGT